MSASVKFDHIKTEVDRSYTYDYGIYTLYSAFQPIIEPQAGDLILAGYQGQIRVLRDDRPYSTADFLSGVNPQEKASIDALMAALHISNARIFGQDEGTIHVTRNPRLFDSIEEMREDAARQREFCLGAGIAPKRLVCDLRLREDDDMDKLTQFAEQMRRAGFQIGLDGYMGEEGELARLRMLSPSFVRFDPASVAELVRTNTGLALLRVIVEQFAQQKITTVFTCVEDEDAIERLVRIGAKRLQGHALARPERAPATFYDRFLIRQDQGSSRQAVAIKAGPSADIERRSVFVASSLGTMAGAWPHSPARRVAPVFGRRGTN